LFEEFAGLYWVVLAPPTRELFVLIGLLTTGVLFNGINAVAPVFNLPGIYTELDAFNPLPFSVVLVFDPAVDNATLITY
jgi:hypothetical protein